MSVAGVKSKKSVNTASNDFTATDGSVHPYISMQGRWLFTGVGAVAESSHAIAGDIPAGSEHVNLTDGTKSIYNGSAWVTVGVS